MSSYISIDASGMNEVDIAISIKKLVARSCPLFKLTNLPLSPLRMSTPSDWKSDCTTPDDAFFLEVSTMLGEVFGYSDLQDGRLIQEIFPIARDASRQVGSGAVELVLHTEDPALEYRADYLGFMCISNKDQIPTVVSIPKLDALEPEVIDRLSQPVFRILSDRPSESVKKNQDLVTPVLFRDENEGFKFIYDPVYLVREELDSKDLEAFSQLEELVQASVTDFLLCPGEIGFIDNYQVAHGRPQFFPRYDGTDRWLKRTQISTSLHHYAHRAIISGRLMP